MKLGKRCLGRACQTLTLLVSVMLFSCSGDHGFNINGSSGVCDVELEPGELFEYDLGFFGDEEAARITVEPEHAALSELDRSDPSKIIYRYRPDPTYTGTDYVELRSERGSDGASPNTDITISRIRFSIGP
ncbi:MAG: hypothetical protein R3281_07055 [Balneolaceae bacterium]|nr:hypothetical protein [Balneolaceae bacterium]